MTDLLEPLSKVSDAVVRDAMSWGVVSLPASATIGACALTMAERRIHAVLIIEADRRTLGWVFGHDVLRHATADPPPTVAADAISQRPATISPDATIEEATQRLLSDELSHLLVGGDENAMPPGVLSVADVVAFCARAYGSMT